MTDTRHSTCAHPLATIEDAGNGFVYCRECAEHIERADLSCGGNQTLIWVCFVAALMLVFVIGSILPHYYQECCL